VSAGSRDRAIRLRTGASALTVGHTAVAGWPEPFPAAPRRFEDVPKAAHDARARLEYTDSIGVWAAAPYPNVGGFGNEAFLRLGDPELMLSSGVLPRFPKLKVVSVESGIGFIPFILEALDDAFDYSHMSRHRPEFTQRPSEYFRQQVFGCYFFEELAPQRLLDRIGVDNVLFETDFPHPVCLYGDVREKIDSGLAGQPHGVRRARRDSVRREPFDLLGVDSPGVRVHVLVVPAAGDAVALSTGGLALARVELPDQ